MNLAMVLILAQVLHVAGFSPRTRGTTAGGPASAPVAARPNDNRVAAGRLANGVLRLQLEVREVIWYPEERAGAAIPLYAFAEVGQAASIPGPLLRVPASTVIRATVRNTLSKKLCLRGLQDHLSGTLDTVDVAPGATRELEFRVDVPGTYYYSGRTEGNTDEPIAGKTRDAHLVGAFIVDPAGVRPDPTERIFVINQWQDTLSSLGMKPDRAYELLKRFGVTRDQWTTFGVNGLSWPHTERLHYAEGDTVRWRVINASVLNHPMHLHGFYFDVLSRGDAVRDTVFTGPQRRKAVTEAMVPGSTMVMSWVPTRPGNWLFHCHLVDHIDGALRLAKEEPKATPSHANHAEQAMAGLVLGVQVSPRKGATTALAPVARRTLRLFVDERANVYGDKPGYSFVLQDGPVAPAADSVRVPSSTIVLHRGEPTEITVINRMKRHATIHWHGIELQSFYDGVGDWSGLGTTIAPPIAPNDSFVVRLTADRAGTFIYHTHTDETEQLSSGLYGPLLVLAENAPRDTTERVFLMGAGGPQDEAPPFVNGRASPPPIELRAGIAHRFRFINIAPAGQRRVRLLGDSAERWRAVAKDGADLPPQQATTRPAVVLLLPGETYDFEVRRQKAGTLTLEITAGRGPVLPPVVTRIPVIVR